MFLSSVFYFLPFGIHKSDKIVHHKVFANILKTSNRRMSKRQDCLEALLLQHRSYTWCIQALNCPMYNRHNSLPPHILYYKIQYHVKVIYFTLFQISVKRTSQSRSLQHLAETLLLQRDQSRVTQSKSIVQCPH